MNTISFPHGGHARDSAYRSIGVYSSHTLGRARAPSERLDLHVLDGLAGQAVLHIPHVSHMAGMQGIQHTGLLASTRRTHCVRDKWPPIHRTCKYCMDSLHRPCWLPHICSTWWACRGVRIAVYWSLLVAHTGCGTSGPQPTGLERTGWTHCTGLAGYATCFPHGGHAGDSAYPVYWNLLVAHTWCGASAP